MAWESVARRGRVCTCGRGSLLNFLLLPGRLVAPRPQAPLDRPPRPPPHEGRPPALVCRGAAGGWPGPTHNLHGSAECQQRGKCLPRLASACMRSTAICLLHRRRLRRQSACLRLRPPSNSQPSIHLLHPLQVPPANSPTTAMYNMQCTMARLHPTGFGLQLGPHESRAGTRLFACALTARLPALRKPIN